MRKASKPPSEWLKLLCKDWALENEVLVETADAKFLDYKPYLKGDSELNRLSQNLEVEAPPNTLVTCSGLLTSQLLCRLSIPPTTEILDPSSHQPYEFWEILGITDSFDRAYIVAQIERFCSLYSIRALSLEEPDHGLYTFDFSDPAAIAAAAAAGVNSSPNGGIIPLPPYIDPVAAAAGTDEKQ
jgi:hypothetical protein